MANSLTRKRPSYYDNSEGILTVENIVFAILMLAIIIAPYYRGLFFRENYFIMHLVCISLLLVLLVKGIITRNINMPNRTIDLVMFGLPLAYLISLFVAVDPGLARDELLKNINYLAVYLILIITIKTDLHRRIVLNTFIVMALWTSLFSYGVAMGNWQFKDAVMSKMLASVFQYHNTFAALVAAAIFMCLIFALQTWYKDNKTNLVKSITITTIYITITNILFTAFILSYSRGVWLVFAAMYVLALLILPLKDKLTFLIFSAIAMIPSIYTIPKATAILEGSQKSGGWQALIVAVAVTAVMAAIFASIYHTAKQNKKRFIQLQVATLILIVIIVAGAATTIGAVNFDDAQAGFQSIINRIQSMQNIEDNSSAGARITFYQDAMGIYKDHPVIGAGGGAWEAMFEKYQSYSYWSTQAHIYYLQLAIETGTVGIIALMAITIFFLASVISIYRKSKDNDNKYLTIAVLMAFLMLMGHNFLDFNMTYEMYAISIWLFIAVITSQLDSIKDCGIKSITNKRLPGFKLQTYVLTLIVIMLFIANIRPVLANNHLHDYDQAVNQKDYTLAQNEMKRAYDYDPNNTELKQKYASYLFAIATSQKDKNLQQQYAVETIKLLEELTTDVPYTAKPKLELAKVYAGTGQPDKAIKQLDNAIKVAPLNDDYYNERMYLGCQVAELYLWEKEDKEAAAKYIKDMFAVYSDMQATKEKLDKNELASKGRGFKLKDKVMRFSIAKANYLSGQYKNAEQMLTPLCKDKNYQTEASAWLAASYNKLGKQKAYDKWLKKANKLNKENEALIQKLNNL